jgi:bacterioferritin-associated ferredoxin
MDSYSTPDACKECPAPAAAATACTGCSARIVCRCLQVTEEVVVRTITTLGLRTIAEVRRHTSAGDGCTCCHGLLAQYLERQEAHASSSAAAICVCK